MRYLTVGEVVELHRRILAQSGGSEHILDPGVASGDTGREEFASWLEAHLVPRQDSE